jgi:pyruvate carboxylase subunit B
MRTYRVDVNDRTFDVSVEVNKGKIKATIGNEVYDCELIRNVGISVWLIRPARDGVRAYIRTFHGPKAEVWLAGLPFLGSVRTVGVAGYPPSAQTVTEKRVGGEIRALMPGRITSILVKEGDTVEAGAPLLILEAMKMQNEIVAPIPGHIKRIHVQEGAAVKKDSELIVIE